jgi:hypothetical protein
VSVIEEEQYRPIEEIEKELEEIEILRIKSEEKIKNILKTFKKV